jgi:hypothetical protein
VFVLLVSALGCQRPRQQAESSWLVVAQDDMTPEQEAHRAKATAARDAMFNSLKGRLVFSDRLLVESAVRVVNRADSLVRSKAKSDE